ncbi:MAG TPA: GPW/gp25 family protein [Anaerolineaceae bacterium]
MNSNAQKAYLGQGLSFPLKVNPRGELALVGAEEDIEQSIRVILGTRPGERVMRPEFGCRAQNLQFEPRTSATSSLVEQYVREALLHWEPRINLFAVRCQLSTEQDGALFVEIEYQIKDAHDRRSIVYPFFLVGEENW